MRKVGLALTGLVLFAAAVAAQQVEQKTIYETWDAAYLEGARSGYVRTTVQEISQGGRKLYRCTLQLVLNVRRFDTPIQLRMETGTWEDAAGKVVGVFMRQYLGAEKKLEINGKVEGKQLTLMLDGTKPLKPAPWNPEVIGLLRQQTMFKDRQVKPGDEFTYLSFEPSINLVVKNTVRVKDYESVEVGGKKTKLLRVETIPEKVENVQLPTLVAWLDRTLEPVRSAATIPGMGQLVLYRTTKEGATTGGAVARLPDIGLNQLVPLNRRIADPYRVRSAVYHISFKGVDDAESAFARDERQSMKKIRDGIYELTVKAGPCGRADKAGDEFLQSSYFITSDDERVRALARQAVADESDPWKKALRIEKWVHGNMQGRNHEAMATADHVARTLQGDCSEYSMLMAAMCRAEGIPSRTAIGLIYADTPKGPAFSYHMWTEVWHKGQWVPLDATLGRGYVGATHLKITDHSWHETRSLTPILPLLRVLGKMSIEVVRTGGDE